MSDNIRRVLNSLIRGWLMSGEVLYCGVGTVSSNYSNHSVPNLAEYCSGGHLLMIGFSEYKLKSSTSSDGSADRFEFIINPTDPGIDWFGHGNFSFKITPSSELIQIYCSDSNVARSLLVIAIPRTDV